MAAGCRNSVASIPQAGTGVMESRKRAVASPISCAEESRIPSAHSRSWMTARRGAIWREDQQRSVRMRSVMLLLLCATGAALVLVSVSEPRPVALRHRPPTAEESETPRSNLGGGLSAPAFPSESFECDYEKAFNASDRLKVFQVYSEPPTSLMEHNRHHLPEGAEFVFVDHLEGMEASMREVSRLLELCGVVEGAYEALMDVRAISTRSNIWRAAMLWAHGGLYMDHKILLTQPLTNFVDLERDTIFLPQDAGRVHSISRVLRDCCPQENAVQTALLWSRPRHPVLEEILKLQVEHVNSRFYGSNPLDTTGPVCFAQGLVNTKVAPSMRINRDAWLKLDKVQNFALHDGTTIRRDREEFHSGRVAGIVATGDAALHAAGRRMSNYSELWEIRQLYCDETFTQRKPKPPANGNRRRVIGPRDGVSLPASEKPISVDFVCDMTAREARRAGDQ